MKGLDFISMKQILPAPSFNIDEEDSAIVVYMDMKGNVNVVEVEIIDEHYNERMKINKREPGHHYFDVFGGDMPDDIGQRQSTLV